MGGVVGGDSAVKESAAHQLQCNFAFVSDGGGRRGEEGMTAVGELHISDSSHPIPMIKMGLFHRNSRFISPQGKKTTTRENLR